MTALRNFEYCPILFYALIFFSTLLACPLFFYISHHKSLERFSLPLLLVYLTIPCLLALFFIYSSKETSLRSDFYHRLIPCKISVCYSLLIFFLMPAVILISTFLSTLFGESFDQFSFTSTISVMKGWAFFGLLIPIILAPLIEEIGWRGYGVDSIRSHNNLLNTSLLFGLFWALWHLPLFFIKGYYHNELWNTNILYTLNFFFSVIAIGFILNWVYYKVDRNIFAIALFHSVLNISFMLWKTAQPAKCIASCFLGIIATSIVLCDKKFFME